MYFLYPWGHKKEDAPDKNHLHHLADVATKAMKKRSGYRYKVGSATKLLYEASGGSDDWAKAAAQIKFSYTIELPEGNKHGFILPASKIKRGGG